MNGFKKGTYEIRYQGEVSDLSGHYKTEEALLDAIRAAPPGKYPVSFVLGANDFEDWKIVTNHGNGRLTIDK
jgi:hypothetical protein